MASDTGRFSRAVKFIALFVVLVTARDFWSGSASILTPCAIQGSGFNSPFLNQRVQVQGVVVVDLDETSRRGFYLQQPDCDADPSTSDGVFVYLGERSPVVQAGDEVVVTGTVQEYYGLTEINTTPADVFIQAHGRPFPSPFELTPPFDDCMAESYFESLEAMLVRMDAGRVVGPTDNGRNTWLLDAGFGERRVFADDPAGNGAVVCVGDGGNFAITPETPFGWQVNNLQGALAFRYGEYCLDLSEPPVVEPEGGETGRSAENFLPGDAGLFNVGTFNLHNLFDTLDDPLTQDSVLTGGEYQRRLEKSALAIVQLGLPDVLAVQEVENETVLQDLANRPELNGFYASMTFDGPDRRGLNVGMLYRPGKVDLLSSSLAQGCTGLVDGLGPDGNLDVENPQNQLTCTQAGDGPFDGNRLFSRPPLVAHFRLQAQPGLEFWVIANHWKSKTEDTRDIIYTLARRVEQARFVARLGAQLARSHPQSAVIVAGDLNDWPGSLPLKELETAGWQQAWWTLPSDARYSYIYRGRSQALDHILAYSPVLAESGESLMLKNIIPLAINADYPAAWAEDADGFWRSSDHDPLLAWFYLPTQSCFLPLVVQKMPGG